MSSNNDDDKNDDDDEVFHISFQIAFEGITQSGYQGDIAIDDVSVTSGHCKLDKVVKSVKVAINSTILEEASKTFARKIKRGRRTRKRPKKKT